jgi:hypothetical protein
VVVYSYYTVNLTPLNFSKIIIQYKINHLLDNPILLKVSNTII